MNLNGQLNLIALDAHGAALVLADAGGAGTAQHLVAVGPQASSELVHLLGAAQAEGDMDVPRPGQGGALFHGVGLVRELQPRAAVKGQEIGAEAGFGVVVRAGWRMRPDSGGNTPVEKFQPRITASATLIPSTAAEVMPPA